MLEWSLGVFDLAGGSLSLLFFFGYIHSQDVDNIGCICIFFSFTSEFGKFRMFYFLGMMYTWHIHIKKLSCSVNFVLLCFL